MSVKLSPASLRRLFDTAAIKQRLIETMGCLQKVA